MRGEAHGKPARMRPGPAVRAPPFPRSHDLGCLDSIRRHASLHSTQPAVTLRENLRSGVPCLRWPNEDRQVSHVYLRTEQCRNR
jgi:hypothetical protein